MSELGLRFEEDAPVRSHRHRGKPAKKKRRSRSWVVFLVVMLLLGGLGVGGWRGVVWFQETLTPADYTGTGVGAVTVEILSGERLGDIGNTLEDADVVASAAAFVNAAEAHPEGRTIAPGFYELPQQLPAATAVEMLLDPANRVVSEVTIPEGLSSFRVLPLLSEELDIPLAELEEAAADPAALGVPEEWYLRSDEREVEQTIEGFLFPATYDFSPDPTAEEVLRTMVGRFMEVADELDFRRTVETERNIQPYDALIVASLAQAEAGVEEDLGRVARVAYNRVYVEGMPLQFDVTVNYWFELNGEPTLSSDEMTVEDLTDPDNPYNREVEGLVPTPINNPGRLALEAAMSPPEGDWLYFVAIDEEGNSAFSSTFEEFCQDYQQAVEAGILSGTC